MIFFRKLAPIVLELRCHFQKCAAVSSSIKIQVNKNNNQNVIRNIGILAHIDAGKTTTTERMLFFSGSINSMGEVHHGNTVTDFMDQERERGITITSASVSFKWNEHNINLLDTPGHIDFTMEVEQTLSVMDGAIVILDGTAGVEAQTITVWRQANRYNIPRIIYVNKMDRPKAELTSCETSIREQLGITPLILQLPLFEQGNIFKGVIDLLKLKKYEWNDVSSGTNIASNVLQPGDGDLWEKSIQARTKLIECLADLDDAIAEEIITDDNKIQTITHEVLSKSIRKVCLNQKGVPVLCGSSYKNIGVQCLLDSVISYLPSPLDSESSEIGNCFGDYLCAKAFKVRHDEHKGPVTFFRIYSGRMLKGQKIYGIRTGKNDECNKLYIPYADDYNEIAEAGAGSVVAVAGLKKILTGEIVTSSSNVFSSLMTKSRPNLMKRLNELLSARTLIPDPVFFCSIEAAFQRQQPALDRALAELGREDPSLRVTVNNETGQTVLGGMGELHLDIIKERLKKEYKLDVDLGPLQIVYRERVVDTAKESLHVKYELGSNHQVVNIIMSTVISKEDEKNRLLLDRSPECNQNILSIHPRHLSAIETGVENALAHGPKLFCPVVGVNLMLHWLEVGRGTPDSVVTSAAVQCVRKLLSKGGTRLLEPIMQVEIVCTEREMESVINDLGRRKAEISTTEFRGTDLVVRGLVPLAQLLGYAKDLRILSSGRACFSMEFSNFKEMSPEEEAKAIKSVVGF